MIFSDPYFDIFALIGTTNDTEGNHFQSMVKKIV